MNITEARSVFEGIHLNVGLGFSNAPATLKAPGDPKLDIKAGSNEIAAQLGLDARWVMGSLCLGADIGLSIDGSKHAAKANDLEFKTKRKMGIALGGKLGILVSPKILLFTGLALEFGGWDSEIKTSETVKEKKSFKTVSFGPRLGIEAALSETVSISAGYTLFLPDKLTHKKGTLARDHTFEPSINRFMIGLFMKIK